MSDARPSVLFVCVKNGGKSQMAAALLRHRVGDQIAVHSAGTRPGTGLNPQSVESLTEVGAPTDGEHPKAVDPSLLGTVDRVVILGSEAQLEATTVPVERWETDEPSLRGIEGLERMRLIRADIEARVARLAEELLAGARPPTRD